MITDNELIAEFMEVPKLTDSKGILWDTSRTGKEIYGLRSAYLHYNDSWDWLMPVVEKIETLGFGFTVDPWGMVIIEYISGNEKEIISFINDNNYPKLFQYYHTVTQFIEWYNDQNK